MKDLRFRAWVEGKGMAKSVISMNFNDNGKHNGVVVFMKGMFAFEIYGGNDIEFMQYAGLKDKYGKEIYEGDILQYEDDHGIRGKVKGAVIFFNAAFRVDRFVKYGTHIDCMVLGYGYPKRHVVIGNIHENPELMSQKDK